MATVVFDQGHDLLAPCDPCVHKNPLERSALRSHDNRDGLLESPSGAAKDMQTPFNETAAVLTQMAIENDIKNSTRKEPLRFDFVGYSIWLEVEERDNDITKVLDQIAVNNGILPIPSAHVTAVYGIDHLPEDEVLKRFDKMKEAAEFSSWPDLRPTGVLVDVEWAGVNGGTMDMAWGEITLSTSPAHEKKMDEVFDVFYEGTNSTRNGPWLPHLSLAYDNPEESVLNLADVVTAVLQSSLLKTKPDGGWRRVTGVSLWSTKGKIDDWKMLDRFDVNV